mmetsp:Transcript_85761/g.195515  ORF Transcript_85761/g.195515 Transcript_85761/m.195515 type:complete len:133 (+) Transcript_85761:19-417(+)
MASVAGVAPVLHRPTVGTSWASPDAAYTGLTAAHPLVPCGARLGAAGCPSDFCAPASAPSELSSLASGPCRQVPSGEGKQAARALGNGVTRELLVVGAPILARQAATRAVKSVGMGAAARLGTPALAAVSVA